MIIFIINGLYDIQKRVNQKLYFDKILLTILILFIVFVKPVFNFINLLVLKTITLFYGLHPFILP